MPANSERAHRASDWPVDPEHASGRPAVSVGREEERTSAGDERPETGHTKGWSWLRQRGGGHGGWHPLRNVLQRTRRAAACRKWRAMTRGARPPTQCVVGGRVHAVEAWSWDCVEAWTVQILEVVACLRPCRDGFVLGRR